MSDEWCAHGPSRNCKDCEIERLEAELAWSNKVCQYYGRLLSEQGIVPDHLEVSDE